MENRIGKSDWLFLLLCLILGIAAEEAFLRAIIGISYLAFTVIFYLVFFWRFRGISFTHQRFGYLLLICIWLLSASYFINYSFFFSALNLLVIPILIFFHLVLITSPKMLNWTKPVFLILLFTRILETIRYNVVFIKIFGSSLKKGVDKNNYQVWKKVFMGVLISVPVLFIVLQLLMAADSQFERIMGEVPQWFKVFDGEIALRAITIVFYCFVFFGLFQTLIKKQVKTLQSETQSDAFKIDGVITVTVLVLVNAVYVLFTVVQFKYFFSGSLQGGFTFAEYARKGFFELLFVTLINLTMIIFVLNFVDRKIPFIQRFAQVLLTILVISSSIMLSSAFLRLSMYEEAYGFTFIRIMAHSFMIFLVVIFMYTLMKIWVKKLSLFHFYFISSLLYYTVMNIVDVEKIIVIKNIERYEQSGKIDIQYLNRLSYPGIIGLVDLYEKNRIVPGLREILQERKRELTLEEFPWQSFNLKRLQAQEKLRELSLD